MNLEGLEVVEAEVDDAQRQVRVTVGPQWPGAVCAPCGAVSPQIQQIRDVAGVPDLPVANRAGTLTGRVSQFGCGRCGRAFTLKLPEVAAGTQATEGFLARAAELIRFGAMPQGAAFLRVPATSVARWA